MSHRSNIARYSVALVAVMAASAVGIVLRAMLGYRFPLISFYPAIMLSAWYGGFWPGVAATVISAVVADSLWLGPLRQAGQATVGDPVALGLFGGIGLVISGFSESLHRSGRREHLARRLAEGRETALGASEARLLASESRLAADATALARLNALSSRLWNVRSRREGL